MIMHCIILVNVNICVVAFRSFRFCSQWLPQDPRSNESNNLDSFAGARAGPVGLSSKGSFLAVTSELCGLFSQQILGTVGGLVWSNIGVSTMESAVGRVFVGRYHHPYSISRLRRCLGVA